MPQELATPAAAVSQVGSTPLRVYVKVCEVAVVVAEASMALCVGYLEPKAPVVVDEERDDRLGSCTCAREITQERCTQEGCVAEAGRLTDGRRRRNRSRGVRRGWRVSGCGVCVGGRGQCASSVPLWWILCIQKYSRYSRYSKYSKYSEYLEDKHYSRLE